MLRSDLCNYFDAYIVAKGAITVAGANHDAYNDKTMALTNNAPSITCLSKINNALIDNAEDLDVAVPM